MENQTRVDLNAALESWRMELAAQANLTAEDRRELETHLRDSIAELKSRGLSEEEIFWLARRRVNQPQKLAGEFVKVDPGQIWRARVFWMALALLAYSLWNSMSYDASALTFALFHGWASHHLLAVNLIETAFRFLPLCAMVALLLKNRVNQNSRLASFFNVRKNLLIFVAAFISLNGCLFYSGIWYAERNPYNSGLIIGLWTQLILFTIWPLALGVFTAWLMPTQNLPDSKHA